VSFSRLDLGFWHVVLKGVLVLLLPTVPYVTELEEIGDKTRVARYVQEAEKRKQIIMPQKNNVNIILSFSCTME